MFGPWTVIGWLWDAWVVSWIIAAIWSRPAMVRAGFAAGAPNFIVTVLGLALFVIPPRVFPHGWAPQLWYLPIPVGWVCVGLVALAIAFTWWARLHLGALWSASVTQKQDHRIVDTGPYGLVRHPIYTGLIFGLIVTAAEYGHAAAVLGAALVTLGLWMKARLEERFLSADLGADYDDYRKRVPMLVPLLRGA